MTCQNKTLGFCDVLTNRKGSTDLRAGLYEDPAPSIGRTFQVTWERSLESRASKKPEVKILEGCSKPESLLSESPSFSIWMQFPSDSGIAPTTKPH